MERHHRFNFDEFDHLCAEALEEDHAMAEADIAREEEQAWADHDRVFHPDFRPTTDPDLPSLPEPPEAA